MIFRAAYSKPLQHLIKHTRGEPCTARPWTNMSRCRIDAGSKLSEHHNAFQPHRLPAAADVVTSRKFKLPHESSNAAIMFQPDRHYGELKDAMSHVHGQLQHTCAAGIIYLTSPCICSKRGSNKQVWNVSISRMLPTPLLAQKNR
jgi:hypothetical protein